MTARVFVRGGSTAIVENVNKVEAKDGFFHLYDVQESETIRGAWRYNQKAIFACDIVEKIFIEDEVEQCQDT